MRSHLPCLPCRDRRPALALRGVLIGSTPNTRRSAARASPQRGAAARGPLPTGCQQHQSERVSRQISVSSARVRLSRRRPSRLLQDHITSTFKVGGREVAQLEPLPVRAAREAHIRVAELLLEPRELRPVQDVQRCERVAEAVQIEATGTSPSSGTRQRTTTIWRRSRGPYYLTRDASRAFMGGSDRRVLKDGALGEFYGRSGEIDEGSSQAVVALIGLYLDEMGISRHLLDVASVTLVSPSLPSAFARPAAYGDSGGDRPCSHRDLGAFLPRNLVNRACMAAERMGYCRPRLRPGLAREAVLCAWGIDEEGKKVLLALSPGTREDTECCRASSRTCGGAASSTLTRCAGRVRDDQPTPARSPAR